MNWLGNYPMPMIKNAHCIGHDEHEVRIVCLSFYLNQMCWNKNQGLIIGFNVAVA